MLLKGHVFAITIFKNITKDRQDKNYKVDYIVKNIIRITNSKNILQLYRSENINI